MMSELLSSHLVRALNQINLNMLNEIRLRTSKPIIVNISGKNFYLTNHGVSLNRYEALVCEQGIINNLIRIVSGNSLYSINDQIINGYISYKNGIRIGVAGDVVSDNDNIKTIKNINSVNIRIPHFIKNCSLPVYDKLVCNNCVLSTLVISAPGAGKTTFLKDLISQIVSRNFDVNVLVVDERCELTYSNEIDLGDSVDVILNCSKKFGFQNGIRSLKPDVIVSDEINLETDLDIIDNALTSGVKVIASIHACDINDLKNKQGFSSLLSKGLFERFVVLNSSCGPGTLVGVYDKQLRCVYC